MFYFFDELGSTIDEARNPKYTHGDVVVAEHQTAGRGQRGREWKSPAGENLMFSVVLDTSFLRATEQFLLLQSVTSALIDVFAEFGLDARIKWPNDIYIGDRKVIGMLIDHTLGANGTEVGEVTKPSELTDRGEIMLSRSGVGIGINVNQTVFDPALPNPTSMALELGRQLDRTEVLQRIYERLMKDFLRADGSDRYHAKLYRLDTPAEYELPDGGRFTGTIRGVRPTGELVMEMPNGSVREFLFRELSFIFAPL